MDEIETTATDTAEAITTATGFDVNTWIEKATDFLTNYGVDLIIALIIFIVGRWIAKFITKTIRNVMTKRNTDPALVSFGTNLIYAILIIFVAIAAIDKIGVETTSLVAILGAAGLAVGFALQGALSNFASGVLIIIFRPFKIGDFIDAGGAVGIVEDISVLVTVLRTPDNKKIIAPNSTIMGGIITNVTAHETRRIDMVFGVSYTDDLEKYNLF